MAEGSDPTEVFWEAVDVFRERLTSQLHDRWAMWLHGHEKRIVHEVVGGLLARQITLAVEFISNPSTWNAHSAPLFLRSMAENCITIAWILKEPEERAEKFVAYGLGQENLLLEHAKVILQYTGIDPSDDADIEKWERWLNSERYTFLTEVNVGNWGPSLREMAEEVGLISLHRNDYARWSGSTHSMWHHVVRFNLEPCTTPLHGYHRIPTILRSTPEAAFMLTAAEYVDLSLRSFDEATGIRLEGLSAVETLNQELEKMPKVPGYEADSGS